MNHLTRHLILRPELLEFIFDVIDDESRDLLGGHIRDESDGEFTMDGGGDDGLAAGTRESSLDAVQRQRGVSCELILINMIQGGTYLLLSTHAFGP